VRFEDYSEKAFKNRADAEEYILHEAYLNAYTDYYIYEYDWNHYIYYYKHYRHPFQTFGGYALYKGSNGMYIEEVELED
jgi:hypothetical protein